VERASREAAIDLHARRCEGARVQLGLRAADAEIDVDLAFGSGPAFRRVGRYGLSPIAEAQDFKTLPAAWRDAFERLAGFVEAHPIDDFDGRERRAGANAETPARTSEGPTFPWRWMAALALLLVTLVWRPETRPINGSRSGKLALASMVTALVIRGLAGPWETFRAGGQGPMWIGALVGAPGAEIPHRNGYVEILGWVARLGGAAAERAVFAANLSMSAAAAGLLVLCLSAIGAHPRAVAAGAIVVALDPAWIRAATSETYFAPIALGVAAATLAGILGVRTQERAGVLAAAPLYLAAALFFDQTARIHPAAWPALATVPAVALLTDDARSGGLAARLAAVAGTIALTCAALSGRELRAMFTEVARHASSEAPTRLWLGTALLALVLVLILRTPPVVRALGFVALALAGASMSRANYEATSMWEVFLRTLTLPIFAGGLLALPTRVWAARWSAAAVASIALGALLFRFRNVPWRPVDAEDNRAFRELLDSVPSSCVVAYAAVDGRAYELPTYHARGPNGRFRGQGIGPSAVDGMRFGCAYYLRGSWCSTERFASACTDVERTMVLVPVRTRIVPARSDDPSLIFTTDPVRIETFRFGVAPE
jgi:hypothetical protein